MRQDEINEIKYDDQPIINDSSTNYSSINLFIWYRNQLIDPSLREMSQNSGRSGLFGWY